MRLALVFAISRAALAALCVAACGGGGKALPRVDAAPVDAGSAGAPAVDGAAGSALDAGPDAPRAPRLVTVTGPVTELAANMDLTLPDSTVQLDGDATKVTSDGTGTFALRVQVRSPFVLVGAHAGHVTTRLYELQLGLDELMFKELRLPTDATFDAWTARLPGYDASKGVVRVEIRAYGAGACGKADGATVALEPAAGSVVYAQADDEMHRQRHLPDPSLTASAATDSLAFAFVHGVPAGRYLVHVTKPGCQAEAWPLVQPTRTYTGRTVVAPGHAVSLPFVVLK